MFRKSAQNEGSSLIRCCKHLIRKRSITYGETIDFLKNFYGETQEQNVRKTPIRPNYEKKSSRFTDWFFCVLAQDSRKHKLNAGSCQDLAMI